MITYVIIKLHSGEQVMAALEEDGNDYIEVSFPMVISAMQVQDGSKIHEHITAKPLCQFSSDRIYRIPKSGILFYKELHEMLIPHYTRIVNAHEDSVLIKPQKQLDWEDEPKEMSLEEIRKRIDMLENMFDENEEDEDKRVFIEGNDTLH